MNCLKWCNCFNIDVESDNTESEYLIKERSPKKKKILKKCLLIGINYTGTSSQLNGCINDSVNLKNFLIKNKYMKEKDIIMMNDHCKGLFYPTKANIMKQLNVLVDFANQHEDDTIRIFFSYSGHGAYLPDHDREESDGKDEVLCPVDCSMGGRYIRDDYLKKEFIDRLPGNVKLTLIIDSCHSKTMLDLKYSYKNDSMIENPDTATEAKCEAVVLCGSDDWTTSADAYIPNKTTGRYEYQGAMTASFLATFRDGISYKALIDGMRKWIKNGNYTQVPHLSSDGYVNANMQFLLGTYDN